METRHPGLRNHWTLAHLWCSCVLQILAGEQTCSSIDTMGAVKGSQGVLGGV